MILRLAILLLMLATCHAEEYIIGKARTSTNPVMPNRFDLGAPIPSDLLTERTS